MSLLIGNKIAANQSRNITPTQIHLNIPPLQLGNLKTAPASPNGQIAQCTSPQNQVVNKIVPTILGQSIDIIDTNNNALGINQISPKQIKFSPFQKQIITITEEHLSYEDVMERINKNKPRIVLSQFAGTKPITHSKPSKSKERSLEKIQNKSADKINEDNRSPQQIKNQFKPHLLQPQKLQISPQLKDEQENIKNLQLRIKQLEMQNQFLQRNMKRESQELLNQKSKNIILESQITVLQKELDLEKKEKRIIENKFNLKMQELQQQIKLLQNPAAIQNVQSKFKSKPEDKLVNLKIEIPYENYQN